MKISRSPKWQHADAKVRLKALAEPLLEQSSIAILASDDPDAAVRIAAIQRLEDEDQLLRLTLTAAADTITAAATQRLIDLYSASNQLPKTALPANLLVAIASTATTPELRIESVGRIQSEDDLLILLEQENHSKVWQQCASQLEQTPSLELIYKRFQSRDKRVLHIVKDKLQQRQDQAQAEAQRMQDCEGTATALVKLALNNTSVEDHRRFNLLQSQWQHLTSQGLPATFNPLLKAEADAAISQNLANQQAREQDQALQAALARATVETLEQLHASLQGSPDALESLADNLQAAAANWPAGVIDESAERYQQLRTALDPLGTTFAHYQALLKLENSAPLTQLVSAADKVQWPVAFASPASLAGKLQDIATRQTTEQAQQAQLVESLASIDKQIAELGELIVAGQLKPATRLHASIGKKLDNFSSEHKTSIELNNRLEQQQQYALKLIELKDWQGFATNPKRTELCEEMEKLRDDDGIAPEEKAKTIKELQEQWKTLGSSDSREGQKLWSRFKRASDKAYEPCDEFFKAQRATREQNLKNKQAICESLEMFDKDNQWDSADWKGVNDIVLKAQSQWRDYNDIPRHKYKKLQQRFTDIIAVLRDRLSAEQERNHELKRALILNIETLLANDSPAAEMVEVTKRSQREWQKIGISERRVDQKLWKQFRTQCDAVFERRDAAMTETKQAVNATRLEALQVYEQLNRLVKDDAVERGQIQQFQQQFRQIDLDRSETKLRKDFDSLCKRATQVIKARANTQVKAALAELRRLAHLCRELEVSETERDTLLASWESEIELPNDWRQRIEQRRDQSEMPDAKRLASNLDMAESLCVRIEILAGIDSPPQAQQRRMQFQVARLNRELSQGLKETRTPDEQLREIQIDWYCLGALPASSTDLDTRFNHAEVKLGFA
jgi:DNA repair protein SbcC/Rad50